MLENNWEYSKENVVPIKRGRAVTDISKAALKPLHNQNEDVKQQNLLEEELSNAKNNADLLINIYLRYYKWIRDSDPANTSKALKLLEVRLSYHKALYAYLKLCNTKALHV
jgi:hypothetical protein